MPKVGYAPASFPDGTRLVGGFYPYKYSGNPTNGILDSTVDFFSDIAYPTPGEAVRQTINTLQNAMAIANGSTNTPPVFIFHLETLYDPTGPGWVCCIGYCLTPGDMAGTPSQDTAFPNTLVPVTGI